LDFDKYHELSLFRTFFSLLTDMRLFDTLLCYTKIQIKFEFGFDPLFFQEVMALPGWPLDLDKYHELSVFCTFSLCLQIGTLLCYTKIQISSSLV
jgi:hypothetical protein